MLPSGGWLGREAAVEPLNDGVVPGGDEGRHVEGTADLGASPEGGALAAREAGIPGQRGDADECADLPPREFSKLRHIGDQGGRGGIIPYALDAGEEGREIDVLICDVARKLGFDVLQLSFAGLDNLGCCGGLPCDLWLSGCIRRRTKIGAKPVHSAPAMREASALRSVWVGGRFKKVGYGKGVPYPLTSAHVALRCG